MTTKSLADLLKPAPPGAMQVIADHLLPSWWKRLSLSKREELVGDGGDYLEVDDLEEWVKENPDELTEDLAEALLINSKRVGLTETHMPVIDLDLNAQLVPSSTEGHYHLFIEKAMTLEDYLRLLEVMADVGLVERGYYEAAKARGYSSVRLPWIKKGAQ